MELKVNICTADSCKITIQDLTRDYIKEFQNSNVSGFKYGETQSVVIIQKLTTSETRISETHFINHEGDILYEIPIKFDGWFKVYYLVLPTLDWINKFTPSEISSTYNNVYFVDNENIYKYRNGIIEKASMDEVIEINPEGTTMSRYVQDNFSICNLKKCYIDLVNKILNSNSNSNPKSFGGRCFSRNIDKDLAFKRDLLMMALNSIKYLIEFCQYAEAQRLLERLVTCNGLCPEPTNTERRGCGCMRMQ